MVFYFFSWVHLHLVDDTRNQTLQETENKPRSTKGSVPHCSRYRRDRRMGEREREDGDRCHYRTPSLCREPEALGKDEFTLGNLFAVSSSRQRAVGKTSTGKGFFTESPSRQNIYRE